jgi:hypothetical protein
MSVLRAVAFQAPPGTLNECAWTNNYVATAKKKMLYFQLKDPLK